MCFQTKENVYILYWKKWCILLPDIVTKTTVESWQKKIHGIFNFS